jgi:DNA-binding MurR/RpiR family transcriptional regulator
MRGGPEIVRHAGLALYATSSKIKYFQAPLASRITQMSVMDALFTAVHLPYAGRSCSNGGDVRAPLPQV